MNESIYEELISAVQREICGSKICKKYECPSCPYNTIMEKVLDDKKKIAREFAESLDRYIFGTSPGYLEMHIRREEAQVISECLKEWMDMR